MGIISYQADQREYDTGLNLNHQELENRPSFMDLQAFGIKITKKPQVLRTIVSGIDADAGRGLRIAANSDPQTIDSKYQSNPALAVFGSLDLSFIIRMVLSLLAILFTYDAITGEKERGTLGLIFSNSLSKAKIILGKAIGGFICLMISLVIPFALALLIFLAYPSISLNGNDWLRIGLMFLLFLLYISVFFMLGLFISARTHRSVASFMTLLIIWVTFVAIIPKISIMGAAELRPIPSANEITVKKDQFLQGLYKETGTKLRDFVGANPPPKSPEDRKVWQEKMMKLTVELADQRQTKYEQYTALIDQDYQLKKLTQDELALNLSRLSPAGSLMFASMSLAKTGLDEHQRFADSVRAYWPVWFKWSDVKFRNQGPPGREGDKLDLSGMPQFNYEPESLDNSIKRAIPDFGLMLFLVIVFFAASYWSFARYDVR
jgi:ABC-type transport system involved in multi-copper enzyme maturation permease subunit